MPVLSAHLLRLFRIRYSASPTTAARHTTTRVTPTAAPTAGPDGRRGTAVLLAPPAAGVSGAVCEQQSAVGTSSIALTYVCCR